MPPAPQHPAASPAPRSWWAGPWGSLLRSVFLLLPLAWLARRVRAREVLAQAQAVGLASLTLAFAFALATVVLGALRWRALLQAYGAGEPPGFGALLRHCMVGQYFSLLPSGLAGDAVRGARVRRHAGDLPRSYLVLLLDRLFGLLGLCVVAGLAMAAAPSLRADPVLQVFDLVVPAALALVGALIILPHFLVARPAWRERLSRVPRVAAMVLRVPASRSPGRVLLALPLSMAVQGAVVACVAALIAPLAPQATLSVCVRVVPPVMLFTWLPLTPGGVGQREVLAVHLFALAGVPPEAAVAASLLYFSLYLALGALGGLCLLLERLCGWEDDQGVP